MASFGNVLDAFVRFLSDTKDIDKALDQTIPQKAAASGQKAGTALSNHFKTIAGGVGGAVFAGAIEGATAFEDQLKTINTVAKLPEETLRGIGDQILDLSRETGKSTDDLTQGFYDLVSAGVPAEEALAVLKDSAVLATGALGTTAETVDLVTSALGAYGLEAKESKRVTDIFAQAVADGKTTAADLAAGISTIAPIAASTGVSLEEIAAGVAIMTVKGDTASQAMTRMRASISALLTPNETLNKLSQRSGKNFADMLKQGVPLTVVLDELRKATEGNDEEFAKALGSAEALTFAFATTGENAGAAAEELEKIRAGAEAGGVAMSQYEIAQSSAAAGGRRLTAEIKAFLIEFGAPFVSTFGGAVTALGLLGPAFGSVRTGAKLTGAALGALLTKGVGPLIGGLKNLAAAGRLGGFLQDLALGRNFIPSVVDGLKSLGSSGPVKAAAGAAGKVLGPVFAKAMLAGQFISEAAGTLASKASPAMSALGKGLGTTAGKAFSVAFAAAAVVGVALTYTDILDRVKAQTRALVDQAKVFARQATDEALAEARRGVAEQAARQAGEAGALAAIPLIGGLLAGVKSEAARGATEIVNVLDEEIGNRAQGLSSSLSGLGGLASPLAHAAPEVRAAAGEVGDGIEEPITQGAETALRSVNQSSQGILDSILNLRNSIVSGAATVANALYDPILKAGELAETEAELRANKQKLISEDLTASERAELEKRNNELRKQLIIQNGELLTYGTQAEQISKTKAFLASNFWVQAYEDATPEQAAALDQWRQELVTHLADMERDAEEGGADTREGYVGELQKGGPGVGAAIRSWSPAAQAAFNAAYAAARHGGYSAGAAYAAGLRASYGLVNDAAYYVAKGAIGPMKASSPPGPESPLHHIGDWAIATVKWYAEKFAGAATFAAAASRTVANAAATGLAGAQFAPALNPALGTLSGVSAGAMMGSQPAPKGGNTYEYHIHAEGQLKVRDPLAAANLLARFQGQGMLPEGG